MTTFIRDFSIITILNLAGAILGARFLYKNDVPASYWIAFGFIALLTLAIHTILIKANEKRAQLFVNAFMAALTAKLLFSCIILLAVGLLVREQLVFTAVAYLIAYFTFTVAEIKDLLPRMKN